MTHLLGLVLDRPRALGSFELGAYCRPLCPWPKVISPTASTNIVVVQDRTNLLMLLTPIPFYNGVKSSVMIVLQVSQHLLLGNLWKKCHCLREYKGRGSLVRDVCPMPWSKFYISFETWS